MTTTPGSTRQDAEGVSRARDDQPAGADFCRGTAGADREDDANDPASDGSECNDRAVEHPRAQLSTREKSDTNVNTELSVVVNHLAKLNDSGVDKVMIDRERRSVEIAKQKIDHSV